MKLQGYILLSIFIISYYYLCKKLKLHDKIIIFGDGINCPQTIDDIAKEGNTISYELLPHIGYRVKHEYI